MADGKQAFFDALANDFNTPAALACMFDWIREANRRGSGVGDADLREMLAVLGLEDLAPQDGVADSAAVDHDVARLLEEREQARARREFQTADRVRDELHARGFEIRDGPDGPELIPLRP
jgi:cysteinyl-tRNA synthetase